MRAIRFDAYGGPEVLKLAEVPAPEPKAGEVQIKVDHVGINYGETLHRKGKYQDGAPPPAIPGMECSGTVAKLGAGVTEFKVGQRVAAMTKETYAEYAVSRVGRTLALPDGVDFAKGAALPIQGLTAYYLLFGMDATTPDKTVLVHSAAGGTGLMCVQMAKLAGAKVIGTVSSEAKAKVVLEAGADHAINYKETDFAEEALRLTGGRGVDYILDSIGRDTVEKGLGVLAPLGHLCMYGFASGTVKQVNPMLLFQKTLKLSGMIMGRVMENHPLSGEGVARMWRWVAEGKLKVAVDGVWPLAEAAEAHRAMESRETSGKLLLKV